MHYLLSLRFVCAVNCVCCHGAKLLCCHRLSTGSNHLPAVLLIPAQSIFIFLCIILKSSLAKQRARTALVGAQGVWWMHEDNV